MKKKLLIIAAVFVLLSLTISGTIAYFNTQDIARNVITSGNIQIDLHETDAQGNPFKNKTGIMPGDVIDKIVTLENVCDNACWVRISLEKSIELAAGKEIEPDISLVKILGLNTTDWTLKQDGYYYYNKKLEKGEKTTPLFTQVKFDETMDNDYMGCTATVTVDAQAVQTANNGSTVFEADGWPAN